MNVKQQVDVYVKKVLKLADDPGLFTLKPFELETLRQDLLRDSLKYFVRKKPEYYCPLLKRFDIEPEQAVLSDLIRLAIPSQLLSNNNWKELAIYDSAEHTDIYHSSGTTKGGTIAVGRSKIDDEITKHAIPNYISHLLGYPMKDGELLMLASSDLVNNMILFRDPSLYYRARGVNIILGMTRISTCNNNAHSTAIRQLVINKDALRTFLKSDKEPKYILGAPISLQQLLREWKDWPIRLGKGGAIFTGGGSKGAETLSLSEMREMREEKILAETQDGKECPAPWYDGLGHTEGLMISLTKANSSVRIPHPLEQLFLVDNNFNLVQHGVGFAGHWNPLNTTYLEAFYPGDIYEAVEDDNYYGKGFVYLRRALLDQNKSVRPGCAASIEDIT